MKKLFRTLLYPLIIILGCAGTRNPGSSDNKQSDIMIISINHYKVPCFALRKTMCFLIKNENDTTWQLLSDKIQGFDDYMWGYNYRLKIRKDIVEKPPADAPAFKYTLIKVLSKEREDNATTFPIILKYTDSESFVQLNEKTGFTMLNEIPIECESPGICQELTRMIKNEEAVEGTFRHSDNYEKLILILLKTK